MNYIPGNYSAAEIVRAGQIIALPKGRETEGVAEWLTDIGFALPDFERRCLHRNRTKPNVLPFTW